jgi:hypothetical protein
MFGDRIRLLAVVGLIGAAALMSCESHSPVETEANLKTQGSDVDLMQAVQRPIEEWLDAQGTFCFDDGMGGCILFVPPAENFLGWSDPAKDICSAFDYAGLANEAIVANTGGAVDLGTTTRGKVTERPLADGRAAVQVVLHTKNANTFGQSACNDFNTDPLTFGSRPADVIAGADAALGNGTLHLKFIISEPGAPLPDLLQLAFFPEEGQELLMLSIYYTAFGTLHSASGYAEGTPGRLTCIETGILFSGFHGAVGDGFPAEMINLQAVGRGGRGSLQ